MMRYERKTFFKRKSPTQSAKLLDVYPYRGGQANKAAGVDRCVAWSLKWVRTERNLPRTYAPKALGIMWGMVTKTQI